MKVFIYERYSRLILIFILLFILFIFPLNSTADAEIPKEQVISLGEVESMALDVKFGIGGLNLGHGEDSIFKGNFHYKNGILKPQIHYGIFEKKGILDLSQSINKNIGFMFSLQNIWDLKLPVNIPLKININAATYNGNIDLSNLQVEEFSLITGASSTNILFNQPNKVNLKKINIKTGASTLSISGLANANFDKMDFKGGAGLYTFDFSGSLRKKSEIKIDVGASKVVLKIPYSFGTRIKFPRFPTVNSEVTGFIKINEQVYVNQEYGKRKEELDIEINGAFLNVEVVSLTN